MHRHTLSGGPAVVSVVAIGCAIGLMGCAGPQIDDRADDVLVAMANRLAAAEQLTIRGRRTLDPDSQAPRSAELTAMVRGADRFAARAKGPGIDLRLFYDGETFALADVEAYVYASIPAPDTVDGLVRQLGKSHGFVPPLADFIVADPYGRLTERVRTGTYVGRETLGRTQVDHLAFTERHIDWDLWVSVADHLPVRLVVVAKAMEGAPRSETDIVEIDLDAHHPDEAFEGHPPPGVTEVEMIELLKAEGW